MPIAKQITPAITMEYRQAISSEIPKLITPAAINGMPKRLAPPPRLPQPAEVAFAVPTILGANIIEVWNCVITKEAPIKPINNLHIRN